MCTDVKSRGAVPNALEIAHGEPLRRSKGAPLGAGWHRANRTAPASCPPPELARPSPMIPPSLARPVREGPGLPERKMPPPDQSPIFLAAACWNVPFLPGTTKEGRRLGFLRHGRLHRPTARWKPQSTSPFGGASALKGPHNVASRQVGTGTAPSPLVPTLKLGIATLSQNHGQSAPWPQRQMC